MSSNHYAHVARYAKRERDNFMYLARDASAYPSRRDKVADYVRQARYWNRVRVAALRKLRRQ